MTPQDIREKTFEKAMFGGYDMGGVDDFMEEAAAELEAAQRENATLRAKMKVLVDKIEEYRASEDAMRMTLMSAQKLSSQIESEARARADKVVAEAQATAARSLESLKAETAKEQAKLKEAKDSFGLASMKPEPPLCACAAGCWAVSRLVCTRSPRFGRWKLGFGRLMFAGSASSSSVKKLSLRSAGTIGGPASSCGVPESKNSSSSPP